MDQLQIIHSIKIIYISKFHCEIQRLAKVIQKIDFGHFCDVTNGRWYLWTCPDFTFSDGWEFPVIIHHGWRKFWDLPFWNGWEWPYNHPPYLEKILRFALLRWLRMAIIIHQGWRIFWNFPFWNGWEWPYNHPPWPEKVLRLKIAPVSVQHGWRKFWYFPFWNGWEWPYNQPPWLEKILRFKIQRIA